MMAHAADQDVQALTHFVETLLPCKERLVRFTSSQSSFFYLKKRNIFCQLPSLSLMQEIILDKGLKGTIVLKKGLKVPRLIGLTTHVCIQNYIYRLNYTNG